MTRSHIAVGGLDITADSLQQVINRFDWDLSLLEELEGAVGEPPPRCMVVDWELAESRELCQTLRATAALAEIPVIAIVDDPWSAAVVEAFGVGVDDYLPRRELDRLVNKVAAIEGGGTLLGASGSGKVVLADPDRVQRVQLAKQLRRMGFDVQFALDAGGIEAGPDVRMVVISAALDVGDALAKRNNGTPWLVTGGRSQLDELQVEEAKRLKLFDTATDPALLVFVANQLLTEEFTQMRASKRLPYGVPIRFGVAEGPQTHGFTYNISLGGLYVRTLTPPAMGTELDLLYRPPHGRGQVLVSGRVAWRQSQAVGRNGVPCGFGLQYAELPLADGAAIEAGYQALAKDLEGIA